MPLGLGLKDLLYAWEWVQRRRVTEVRHFGARQPLVAANTPSPHFNWVAYYTTGQVGTPLPIVISVTNIGADAIAGGVTVSFPTVPRNGEGAYIAVDSDPEQVIQREMGDEVISSDRGSREVFSARYLMRELQVEPWRKSKQLDLRLIVTPTHEGGLPFLVTSWAAAADWRSVVRSPATDGAVDQQTHRAFPYVINVLSRK
jgi:hypothetical protein